MFEKLQYYGIRNTELDLFKSYLTNRKQYVELNNSRSFVGDILHGVPQGSILGPLLFTIYINDIVNLELNGKIYLYADDISIFYPYKHETALRAYMQKDADMIFEFARLNKLVINATKTKVIRFKPHLHTNVENFGIIANGEEVLECNSVKYLGVILQSNLKWNLHIETIKSKIYPVIGILYKFKYKFNETTKLMIYQTLIQSHLNYLIMIYGYKNNTELQSLQRVQNKALKTVYNLPLTYPTITLYKEVCKNILPVNGTYKLQLLIFVFKSLYNIGHNTIVFSRNQTTLNTRNSSNLRTTRCRLETTKQRVEHIGCFEYNNLPQYIKSINTVSALKINVKKFLLRNLEMLLR